MAIQFYLTNAGKAAVRDGTSAPAYSLTADKAVVDESGKVTFKLVTSGLDVGTPVDWSITGIQEDDISPSALSGQFIVDATGKASYTVDVVEDNKTEGNEFLKFALTYIPNKQVSVLIVDTSKYPEGVLTYYEGIHEIEILPNQTVQFHLHGAMGGGAGSIWSGSSASANGMDGGEVSCTIDTAILTAGGGKAGTWILVAYGPLGMEQLNILMVCALRKVMYVHVDKQKFGLKTIACGLMLVLINT